MNDRETNHDEGDRTKHGDEDMEKFLEWMRVLKADIKEHSTKVKFWVEVIGLVGLFFYASIAALQWCEMKNATKASEAAAQAATSAADTAAKQLELTSRPWVDIDVFITSPVTYDSQKGMDIGFTFVPKNVGQSPAQNVSIAPILTPATMGEDLRTIQKRICENLAQDQDASLKYVIFPGKNYSQEIGMGMSNSEINSRWSKVELSQGPIDLIPITLVGCVDYTYESSPRHHQTGFALDVLMKDSRIVLKSKTPLAPESLTLRQHPTGGHFAN